MVSAHSAASPVPATLSQQPAFNRNSLVLFATARSTRQVGFCTTAQDRFKRCRWSLGPCAEKQDAANQLHRSRP